MPDGVLPLLDDDLRLLADAAAISLFHCWTRTDPYEVARSIDGILSKQLRLPIFVELGRSIIASSI
jgi:hypothetical protein